MEVLLSPYQRPTPGMIFHQVGGRDPQLPRLTEGKGIHVLSFRNSDLKEMVRLNPELKHAPWHGHIPSLDNDSVLMITLLKPMKVEPCLARSHVAQNVYGAAGHLLLRSFSPVKTGEMNTFQKRVTKLVSKGGETKMRINFGRDISKNFVKTAFLGSKCIEKVELQYAVRELRQYVNSADNDDSCPVLQQGPLSQEVGIHIRSELKGFSCMQKDPQVPCVPVCEVHKPQRWRDQDRPSSGRDSRMSVELLACSRVQSKSGSPMPRASSKMKGCDGKKVVTATRPRLLQYDVKEKFNGLKHEETYYLRDLSTCLKREEGKGGQEEDARVAREWDRNTAAQDSHVPIDMGVSESAFPHTFRHVGDGRSVSVGMAREEGTSGLSPEPEKPWPNHDHEEAGRSSGKATAPCSGPPAAVAASLIDSTVLQHPDTSQKNPDASLLTKGDRSSISSKPDLFGKEGTLDILQPAEVVSSCVARDDDCGIRRKYFGSTTSVAESKTVLLLGAKGSGKTCLINAVANFIMGVKSNAEKKLTVSDETVKTGGFSSTENITGYTFVVKDHEEDVSLTLIDTPGLNDSSGNEVRDHVESLKTFLVNAAHKKLEIHGIALVVQAHLVRLTSSERLVMDHLKALFGQDVSDHVVNLITFADNQNKPPVVEALDFYGMSTRHCFKFNNSVFCGSSEESEQELDRAYWKTSQKSWKKCWKVVRDLSPLKTNAMKSIQKELYATNVRDSVMRELHVEMKSFMKLCKNAPSNKIDEGRRRIWDLAHVVYQTQQETERVHYTSVDELVEKKYNECMDRDYGNQKDLHLLMVGFPVELLEPVKAILTSNMDLIQLVQTRAEALHRYKGIKKGYTEKLKAFVGISTSDQEEIFDAEEILSRIEETVIDATYKSVSQMVERYTGAFGSKLSVRSFLLLLKGESKEKCLWMVIKLLHYEESRTKNRIHFRSENTREYRNHSMYSCY